MGWVPLVFVIFKLTVFGFGMFFAIKWHYDRGRKNPDHKAETRTVILSVGKVAILFTFALVALWFVVANIASRLGLNLTN